MLCLEVLGWTVGGYLGNIYSLIIGHENIFTL